ncbi:MAG: hypothetical protein WCJ64_09310 [Rhodospirillaceae bacterium]
MLIRFCEAVLLAAFFSAVAYGSGRLIGSLATAMIEKGANLDQLRAMIARRSALERGLSSRVGDRRRDMAALDRDIKELVRKRIQLEQEIDAVLETPDRIMRQIGQEVRGMQLYLALVLNKYVSNAGGSSTIDPAWASAQEVAVWAAGVGEARGELERRYPESQGFKVTSLVDAAREAAVVEPEIVF